MLRRQVTVLAGIALAAGLLAVHLAEAQQPRQKKTQRPRSRRPGDLRHEGRLKIGDPAPDFTLRTLDGKKEVALSSFKGKQPVMLVFGSYT